MSENKKITQEDTLKFASLLEEVENELDEYDSNGKNYYDLISSAELETYDTTEEYNEHQRTIRDYIIKEYENKMFYRKVSFWSILTITGSLLVFIYSFLFLKADSASLSLLITLTVSVFANLIALIGIVFKYVFSSTTEIMDYSKNLYQQDKENNN